MGKASALRYVASGWSPTHGKVRCGQGFSLALGRIGLKPDPRQGALWARLQPCAMSHRLEPGPRQGALSAAPALR